MGAGIAISPNIEVHILQYNHNAANGRILCPENLISGLQIAGVMKQRQKVLLISKGNFVFVAHFSNQAIWEAFREQQQIQYWKKKRKGIIENAIEENKKARTGLTGYSIITLIAQ